MSFSWWHADGGAWIEIIGETVLPGAAEGGGDWRVYPSFVANLRDNLGPEAWAALGFAETVETPQPTGVRVLGRTITDVDGAPTETWQTEPLTLADLKAQALAAIDAEYEARRTNPMPWNFGATAALNDLGWDQGPAGVQTLQMRESPRDDLKNWLAVAAGASAAVAGGAPGLVMPIKVTANVWVQTTAAQLVQVLISGDGVQLSALQRGTAMLQRYGQLKAQNAVAEDAQAVAAVLNSLSEGWPA